MHPSENLQKLDALRSFLRLFLDRSRAVVQLHGLQSIASNFWLPMYAFAKPIYVCPFIAVAKTAYMCIPLWSTMNKPSCNRTCLDSSDCQQQRDQWTSRALMYREEKIFWRNPPAYRPELSVLHDKYLESIIKAEKVNLQTNNYNANQPSAFHECSNKL